MLIKRHSATAALVTLLAVGALALPTVHHPSGPTDNAGGSLADHPGSLRPGLGGVGAASLLRDEVRPNVVVIMADDMREDDLRFMPNVQRLIGDEGVHFANMFSPQPLCCPARASFLTGQYTHNHGVWSHAEPFGFRVFRDKATLPVWLHDVGYNTVFLGKYLNGYGLQPLPDGSSSVRYVPPGWSDWRGAVDGGFEEGSAYAGSTYKYFDTTLNVNGVLEPHQGKYQTRMLGRQTEQIIAENARSTRPFFFWASYVAPHHGRPFEPDDPGEVERDDGATTTFKTPARPGDVKGKFDDTVLAAPGVEGEKDVSDKPFFIRELPPLNDAERAADLNLTRQRAEALAVLDEEVARTIEALEDTGELDNTIVAFTSDNGFFLGEHRNRKGKILPYEPSLRVPLMMRGPGIPKGVVRFDPFTMIDFAPTFLAAAGAAGQDSIDGVSMLDVARGGDQGWDRGILTQTGPREVSNGVEESDNFLVEGDGPSPLRFSQGVRTGQYLYVEHASREKELYDLYQDPGELDNLLARGVRRVVADQLARVLDLLRNCAGEACAAPLPESLRSRPR